MRMRAMPPKSRKSSSPTKDGPVSAMNPRMVDSKKFITRPAMDYRSGGTVLLTPVGKSPLSSSRRARLTCVTCADSVKKFLSAEQLQTLGRGDDKAQIHSPERNRASHEHDATGLAASRP